MATAPAQMAGFKRLGQTESLSFAPGGSAAAYDVDAVVERKVPNDFMSGTAPSMLLTVLVGKGPWTFGTTTVGGIDPADLDTGASSFTVAERRNGTATARGVMKIVDDNDPELLVLLLR